MKYTIYDDQFRHIATIDFSTDNFKNLDKKIITSINKIKSNSYFDLSKETSQKAFIKFIFEFMVKSQKNIDEESRKIILSELSMKNSNLYVYQNSVERRFYNARLWRNL